MHGALPNGGFPTGTLKTESTSSKEVVLLQALSLFVFTMPLQLYEPYATVLFGPAVGSPTGIIGWLEYGFGLTSVGRIFNAIIPRSQIS